jgi:hypothetical protein
LAPSGAESVFSLTDSEKEAPAQMVDATLFEHARVDALGIQRTGVSQGGQHRKKKLVEASGEPISSAKIHPLIAAGKCSSRHRRVTAATDIRGALK